MKIDTLNFLNCLLISHDDKLFHPYLDALIPVNLPFPLSLSRLHKLNYLHFS